MKLREQLVRIYGNPSVAHQPESRSDAPAPALPEQPDTSRGYPAAWDDPLPGNSEPDPLTLAELETLLGYAVQPADWEPDPPADGFQDIGERDRRQLLCPPQRVPPCTWCGGRNIHATDCFTLDTAGPMVMKFGKHRGTSLACLDRKYLLWLRDNAGADFASAISERRRCPPLTPEQRQEIRRLLHGGKHDYQHSSI